MEDLLSSIATKKAEMDRLRPLSPGALQQLQRHYDIELTYSSNAIEGNTLTLRETAEVIEHGLTVGGKRLRDHLEAVDHYDAILWVRDRASSANVLDEEVVCELHRRIVARSQPSIAGIYNSLPRRIVGSSIVFPNPARIPVLMRDFSLWLATAPSDASAAFAAHFKLVAIHPFSDGNGRTARILMNMMLIRGGYPPVSVRPQDRLRYLASLERASLTDDLQAYETLMNERLDATLDDYLSALREALP